MPRGVVLNLTPAEVVARARSLCVVPDDPAARIYYCNTPGRNGGADPEAITCASLWRDRKDTRDDPRGRLWATADCVGFALWAYGCDRLETAGNGEGTRWWNQNSIWLDATEPGDKRFAHRRPTWRFCDPYPGCLALIRGPIPGDKRVGHMAVVTKVVNGQATTVVHCSGSGKRRHGQAIGEDPIDVAFGKGPKARPVYYVERCPIV
jgi:hypothetical protein